VADEEFPLVNDRGEVIGRALRSQVHKNPALMHPVVHCLVVNSRGDFLLQLRSRHKDVQPGRWDTSVGGHVAFGEAIESALAREMREELGLDAAVLAPRLIHRYVMRSEIETELVYTYLCETEGPFVPEPDEIDEVRFWSAEQIAGALGTGTLTPNFEDEFQRVSALLTPGTRVPSR
jgi:isopentenyldiphosphate isomerase